MGLTLNLVLWGPRNIFIWDVLETMGFSYLLLYPSILASKNPLPPGFACLLVILLTPVAKGLFTVKPFTEGIFPLSLGFHLFSSKER